MKPDDLSGELSYISAKAKLLISMAGKVVVILPFKHQEHTFSIL